MTLELIFAIGMGCSVVGLIGFGFSYYLTPEDDDDDMREDEEASRR